jgi:hypothetical protein
MICPLLVKLPHAAHSFKEYVEDINLFCKVTSTEERSATLNWNNRSWKSPRRWESELNLGTFKHTKGNYKRKEEREKKE